MLLVKEIPDPTQPAGSTTSDERKRALRREFMADRLAKAFDSEADR